MSADTLGTGGAGGVGDGGDEGRPSGGGMSPQTMDRLIALVLLACALFNPPILRAFGAGDTLFGWPLIYLYIFFVWAAVIVMAALLLDRRGGG